jgi:N-acetylglucosamine-6-phosphate deacetylase
VGRELEAPDATRLNAKGLTAGPGFVDVHVHGGGGHSFFTSDPENIRAYARWAPRNGVTGLLVSTVGRDAPETESAFAALAPAIGEPGGAEALGFHMEGPFINPERKGAFPAEMLRLPSAEEFARFQAAAGGAIRQVTFAPELPGGLTLARAIAASGAVPAVGHTDATAEEARAGFDAGARHVTHLFNAMRPLHQREGGPIAACLLEERATCELICDGAHVAPEVLRMAYRILGPSRTVVVTDNLHIAGTQESGGTFGGQVVEVSGAKAVRTDGTIVGSVATMDQHFRNTIEFLGIDVSTAFRLCSTNPVRVAGAQARKGAIAPGMDGDVVLLDAELRVAATVCRGELAFERQPGRLSASG